MGSSEVLMLLNVSLAWGNVSGREGKRYKFSDVILMGNTQKKCIIRAFKLLQTLVLYYVRGALICGHFFLRMEFCPCQKKNFNEAFNETVTVEILVIPVHQCELCDVMCLTLSRRDLLRLV